MVTAAPPSQKPLRPSSATTAHTTSAGTPGNANSKLINLEAQLVEAAGALYAMAKERDFYFGKLRKLEVALQTAQSHGDNSVAVNGLLAILYATEEGFESGTEATPHLPSELETF
jgi:hypothetical protein